MSWDQLGSFDLLAGGHQLGESALLFEKIEDEVIEKQIQKLHDTKKANEASEQKAKPVKEAIQFDTFEKLDIRVGPYWSVRRYPNQTNCSASCSTTGCKNGPSFPELLSTTPTLKKFGGQTGLLYCQPGTTENERNFCPKE